MLKKPQEKGRTDLTTKTTSDLEMQEEEIPNGEEADSESLSALDPANFNTVLLIMLNRLYDLQLAFLATVNPDKAEQLYDLHASGQYLAPPPSILVD